MEYSLTVGALAAFAAFGFFGQSPLASRGPYLQGFLAGDFFDPKPEFVLELLELVRGFFGQRPSASRGPYLQGRLEERANGAPPGIVVAAGDVGTVT